MDDAPCQGLSSSTSSQGSKTASSIGSSNSAPADWSETTRLLVAFRNTKRTCFQSSKLRDQSSQTTFSAFEGNTTSNGWFSVKGTNNLNDEQQHRVALAIPCDNHDGSVTMVTSGVVRPGFDHAIDITRDVSGTSSQLPISNPMLTGARRAVWTGMAPSDVTPLMKGVSGTSLMVTCGGGAAPNPVLGRVQVRSGPILMPYGGSRSPTVRDCGMMSASPGVDQVVGRCGRDVTDPNLVTRWGSDAALVPRCVVLGGSDVTVMPNTAQQGMSSLYENSLLEELHKDNVARSLMSDDDLDTTDQMGLRKW